MGFYRSVDDEITGALAQWSGKRCVLLCLLLGEWVNCMNVSE